MVKKLKVALTSSALAISLWGCASAPTGFYAPEGSTVTLNGNAAVIIPSGGGAQRRLLTVTVKVTKSDPPDTADGIMEPVLVTLPGNDIFVRMVCDYCTFLEKAPGDEDFTLDTAVDVGSEATFKTGADGVLVLGMELDDPIALNFTAGAYVARVQADIRVAQAFLDVAVSML